jgi:hypothetical protein
VAVLLVAGCFVFLIGAAFWKLEYQAPLETSLAAIGAAQGRWRWIHLWMVTGIVVTLLGLTGFTVLLFRMAGPVYSSFGVVVFAAGALCWLPGVFWRLTVLQAAAADVAAGRPMPEAIETWSDWFGHLHMFHMLTAYLSWLLLGAAVIDTGIVGEWVGWLGVALGAAGMSGYVTIKGGPFAPPILAHFYPLILGVSLWVERG